MRNRLALAGLAMGGPGIVALLLLSNCEPSTAGPTQPGLDPVATNDSAGQPAGGQTVPAGNGQIGEVPQVPDGNDPVPTGSTPPPTPDPNPPADPTPDPDPDPPPADSLYKQIGTDRSWAQLLAANAIPIGTNSTGGVLGSTIDVNNVLVEVGPSASRRIEQAIQIHTLGNSVIPRRDFHKWTRWYQEDGKTQVFRLFNGEHNVRNTRTQAARVEAFSDVRWSRGAWHEWVGRYTIIKADGVNEPHNCAIFQAKNPDHDWSVMLNLTRKGDIILNHRRNQSDVTIAKNMIGKSFDIRVRDNGYDYEVYMNGTRVGDGSYDRPTGDTAFRWGLYVGATDVTGDIMVFVTGATVDP